MNRTNWTTHAVQFREQRFSMTRHNSEELPAGTIVATFPATETEILGALEHRYRIILPLDMDYQPKKELKQLGAYVLACSPVAVAALVALVWLYVKVGV